MSSGNGFRNSQLIIMVSSSVAAVGGNAVRCIIMIKLKPSCAYLVAFFHALFVPCPCLLILPDSSKSNQMLVIYVPWLQRIFQTEALSLSDLAYIIVVTSSMVVLDTARKVLFPDRQESQVGSFHLKSAYWRYSVQFTPNGEATIHIKISECDRSRRFECMKRYPSFLFNVPPSFLFNVPPCFFSMCRLPSAYLSLAPRPCNRYITLH